MLSTVSWQAFFTLCGVTMAFYYLVVLGTFYRSEIMALLQGKFSIIPGRPAKQKYAGVQSQALYNTVPVPLQEEILAICRDAGPESNRAELFYALGKALQTHQVLSDPSLQETVNSFIKDCFRENAGIDLDDPAIGLLWRG